MVQRARKQLQEAECDKAAPERSRGGRGQRWDTARPARCWGRGVQPEGTVGTEVLDGDRSPNVRGPKLQHSEWRSRPLHHVALSGPGLRWLFPQSKGSDLPNCALKAQCSCSREWIEAAIRRLLWFSHARHGGLDQMGAESSGQIWDVFQHQGVQDVL